LKILKILTVYLGLNKTNAQADIIVPGSQLDDHGCVLDGGYSWCETNQQCQRSWETPCLNEETDFCPTSNIQTCRMMCDDPVCSNDHCAMRIGNCCDFTCTDLNEGVKCPQTCPPPAPCPMPYLEGNCLMVNPVVDHCGCTTGCPTVDCSHQQKISEGGTCGGFMPYGMAGVCEDGLECVYTMGPMIADAPGICQRICQTTRDSWGNCIDEGCSSWFDGCNTCSVDKNLIQTCTEIACYEPNNGAECRDDTLGDGQSPMPVIPNNCVTWYDGCNSCSVNRGELQGCTMMYCFTENKPYCQTFSNRDLRLNDVCYRFCEDNSQNTIDLREACPIGTECTPPSQTVVSYDSCDSRAHICKLINIGH
jgi:hypothetical protein